jgi:dihydropteroate synthase
VELMAERRTLIMGVLNVTPDSFSDGGEYLDTRDAVNRGMELAAQGADIVDVGGESTRPGAERVTPEEEQYRVLPVVSALTAAGVAVSIDTMNASTAILAVESGAEYINDVSGGLADFFMPRTAASTGVTYIASHWRGQSFDMDAKAIYKDAPTDIRRELINRANALLEAGIARDKLVLDPGLGFAKTAEHNWQMLGRMDELMALGYPILVGASRKRFLTALLTEDSTLDDRDNASVAVSVLAANAGAWGVRVHDVARTYAALRASVPSRNIRSMAADTERERRVAQVTRELAELEFDLDAELAIATEMRREEETRQKVIAALMRQAKVQAEEAAARAEAARLAALPQGTLGFAVTGNVATPPGPMTTPVPHDAQEDQDSRA